MKKRSQHINAVLICCAIALVTLAVFWQVYFFDFIDFDDDLYVTRNTHLCSGITGESLRWAFTCTDFATWQPMVWLSYLLEHSIWGLHAGAFHLTNVFIHTANALLLFLLLLMTTGALWRSALVAALFALHPLHVESVAWIAERKDVLSTFFWLLAMIMYCYYARRRSFMFYCCTLASFILGLMAKPMLVTLPFVLLLFDYWPLGRLRVQGLNFGSLVLEKIPFFALALGSCVLTYVTQQQGGGITVI